MWKCSKVSVAPCVLTLNHFLLVKNTCLKQSFEMAQDKVKSTLEEPTRQQLLEAAGAVFAEHGFRAATIRQICQRAGANVAAVNYHFDGKAGLYAEVLRYAHHCAEERHPAGVALDKSLTPERELELFVHAFLQRLFDEGRTAWLGKLMSREMVEPTTVLDSVVEEQIKPNSQRLQHLLRRLLGARASVERVRLCEMSVVSQCLFYHHCRPVISRLFPGFDFSTAALRRLAAHITQFSLAGLRRAKKERV